MDCSTLGNEAICRPEQFPRKVTYSFCKVLMAFKWFFGEYGLVIPVTKAVRRLNKTKPANAEANCLNAEAEWQFVEAIAVIA